MKQIDRMFRTNLVIDRQLLKEATRALGTRTYSDAVNQSLAEAIRIVKIREMFDSMETAVWEGDLSEMRQDKLSKKDSRR